MMARIISTAVMAGLFGFGAAMPGWSQTVSAPLSDPPPAADNVFDAAFQCPETLPGDAARRQALVDYFHWSQARHPDWSVAEAVEFKKTLLVRHHCADSLRDLAVYTKRENK